MTSLARLAVAAASVALSISAHAQQAELGTGPNFPLVIVPPPDLAVQAPRPDRAAVIERYHTQFVPAAAVASGWSGNVASCSAGTTTAAFKQAVLERVNFYRFLAALPPVGLYTGSEATDVQNAALYVDANSTTAVPSTGTNFCDSASSTSGRINSVLALGAYGTGAIDLYLDDSGASNGAVGHRRMLLFPPLANVATGDIPPNSPTGAGANATWVAGPFGTRPFTPQGTAWPPSGYVPWDLMPKASNRWSFSYPGAGWVAPTASVSRYLSFGVDLEPVDYAFGDSTLVFKPKNFQYAAPGTDVPYTVAVGGFLVNGSPYNASYDVIVIDPAQLTTSFAGDFDGDGKRDILWHDMKAGNTYIWLMNGLTYKAGSGLLRSNPDWRPTHLGDFNGDGKSDIVWRNDATGATELWLMNGSALMSSATLAPAGTLRVTHVADFHGDGKSDLVWYNDGNGQATRVMMNGTTPTSTVIVASGGTRVALVGDFDGDGKADFLLFTPAAAGYWVQLATGQNSPYYALQSPEWIPTHTGDFNGDGKTDILWRRVTTGETNMWLMNGFTFSAGRNLLNYIDWYAIGTGDFDGDGKSDILWRNRVTGETAMWLMNGLTLVNGGSLIANRDWQPTILGNFDGDAGTGGGRQDILWRNTVTGQHTIWLMNGFVPSASAPVLNGNGFWPSP